MDFNFLATSCDIRMLASICIVVLFLAQSGTAQEQDSLPANIPQVTIEGRNAGTCPSAAVTEQALNNTKETIRSILRDTVFDAPCRTPCGGPGWRKIAHLDMSNPDQQCPSNWRLIATPVRACGRTSSACDSAVFPSNGASYSHVHVWKNQCFPARDTRCILWKH